MKTVGTLKAEDEDFQNKVKIINKTRAEIDKLLAEIDKFTEKHCKELNKIENFNKSIDLFLTILTFGIYKKKV